jgi:transposase
LGGVPFIPFKSNVTGKAKGVMTWNRMHQYFQQHRDEFMGHYHKRSNAETVFAMVKTKIGTKLSNEKEMHQFNEALVKRLVHNIIVLIHEMHELGVEVDLDYCAQEVLAQK